MGYCGRCGTQIYEGQNFCAGCGVGLGADKPATQQSAQLAPLQEAFMQPGSHVAQPNLATARTQSLPLATSSGKKILIALFVIFLVGTIASSKAAHLFHGRTQIPANCAWLAQKGG
jgi:uncharacterized membrane protein YvbJ